MNESTLQNLLLFMDRVTCTGKECMAWAETYQSVHMQLASLRAAEQQAIVDAKVKAALDEKTATATGDVK